MKKILLFSTAAVFFLAACNSSDQATVKGMNTGKESPAEVPAAVSKSQRNRQTVEALFSNMNKHDVASMFSAMAPDCMDYGDGSGKPAPLDSVKAGMANWFTAFPDFKSENKQVMADGDWVMVWSDQSGTWKGYLSGQKPTGKAFKAQDVDIFRLNAEGKVTEHHNILSFATLAQQIGFKLK